MFQLFPSLGYSDWSQPNQGISSQMQSPGPAFNQPHGGGGGGRGGGGLGPGFSRGPSYPQTPSPQHMGFSNPDLSSAQSAQGMSLLGRFMSHLEEIPIIKQIINEQT